MLSQCQHDMLRQRKNVIIASCVIWFFHFANVSISSITYSDIEFKIDDKSSVYVVLWVFYVYAILRFFVYFVEDGWGALKFSFIKVLDESCYKRIQHEAKGFFEDGNPDTTFTFSELSIGSNGFGFKLINNDVVNVSCEKIIPCVLKGLVVFMFLRTALTDYVFPFLIALFVLWNSGFSDWNGALINIL